MKQRINDSLSKNSNSAKKGDSPTPSLGRAGEGSLARFWIFLTRLRHCAGFGVQSPTDYAFVREVIYERWPYASYAELEAQFMDADKFLLKLSQLLLRVANHAQATETGIIGTLPPIMEAHLKAGCHKSEIHHIETDDKATYPLVIATELNEQWHEYTTHDHIISFDLHYLGIAFHDEKRYTEGHIINFY